MWKLIFVWDLLFLSTLVRRTIPRVNRLERATPAQAVAIQCSTSVDLQSSPNIGRILPRLRHASSHAPSNFHWFVLHPEFGASQGLVLRLNAEPVTVVAL